MIVPEICNNMKRISGCRGILFDFGGTLDSDGEHWLDRFVEHYRESLPDIPFEEIKRVFYQADRRCDEDPSVNILGLRPLMTHHVHLQFLGLGIDDPAGEAEIVGSFCKKTESFLSRNAVILAGLRPRFRMGVVSNFYGNVEVLCGEAGLASSLDVILDSTRVGLAKPDPRLFRTAIASLGLSPEQVAFVGDSFERDMVPARELGMVTIWMKGPNPRLPEAPGAIDACITALDQLEALLS